MTRLAVPRLLLSWPAWAGIGAAIAIGMWLSGAPFGDGLRVAIPMSDLIRATGTVRFAEARLSDPFAWGPPPAPDDGPRPSSVDVQEAALRLRALSQAEPSATNLRGAGIARLALGHVPLAVETLEEAVRLGPGDVAARVDLSASLLERWQRTGESADAARALDEAERVRHMQPTAIAALFNRALALEALGMSIEAVNARDDYLELDPSSALAMLSKPSR